MLTKRCPICGEEVLEDFFDRHRWREQRVIKAYREDHPDWDGNGAGLEECLQEYKHRHAALREEARRLRQARGEFFETAGEDLIEDVGEDNPDAELHVATEDFDFQHQAED